MAQNTQLQPVARLRAELLLKITPRMILRFLLLGSFPKICTVEGDLAVLPMRDNAPETRIAEIMRHVTCHIRLWRSAIGNYETGYLASENI